MKLTNKSGKKSETQKKCICFFYTKCKIVIAVLEVTMAVTSAGEEEAMEGSWGTRNVS